MGGISGFGKEKIRSIGLNGAKYERTDLIRAPVSTRARGAVGKGVSSRLEEADRKAEERS